jgi:lipopolysaccharide export system ATP-binding protein
MYKRARESDIWHKKLLFFRKLSIEDNILSVLQLTNLSKEEQVAKMESLIADLA